MLERRLVDIYKRGAALHLPGAARRRVVRRPAEPLQVPLPHQPAGPGAGGRRREAPEPGGASSATTCSTCGAARPQPRGARGGVLEVRRAGRGARPAAGPAPADRPEHRAAAGRAASGTRPGSTTCSPRWSAPAATRRPAAGAAATRLPGSITTADIGKLDWPVEGAIVYRFGRDTLPSGGVIRWNGIGIAASAGTPVKAVESGKVRLVGQFGTYGLTVVLEHGNGYYSVYSHLQSRRGEAGRDGGPGRDDRRGGRRELRLRAPPALRDPGREPDRAGSGGLAAEGAEVRRTPRRRSARRPAPLPAPERGLDQREHVVGLGDRGMGEVDDAGAERRSRRPPASTGREPSRSRIRPTDRRAPATSVSGRTMANAFAAVAGHEVGQAKRRAGEALDGLGRPAVSAARGARHRRAARG